MAVLAFSGDLEKKQEFRFLAFGPTCVSQPVVRLLHEELESPQFPIAIPSNFPPIVEHSLLFLFLLFSFGCKKINFTHILQRRSLCYCQSPPIPTSPLHAGLLLQPCFKLPPYYCALETLSDCHFWILELFEPFYGNTLVLRSLCFNFQR